MSENQINYLVAKRIKFLRKKRGMTQLVLSRKSSMRETALQRLESGRISPTVKTLQKVANGLNVHVIELFDFREL